MDTAHPFSFIGMGPIGMFAPGCWLPGERVFSDGRKPQNAELDQHRPRACAQRHHCRLLPRLRWKVSSALFPSLTQRAVTSRIPWDHASCRSCCSRASGSCANFGAW